MLDRRQLFELDNDAPRRRFTAPTGRPFTLRQADSNGASDGNLLTFEGWASVTDYAYPVFGGTFPGWMETMAAGAFKRTLNANADVAFLVNHEGMTLARTKSGTMRLDEDDIGLHVLADLDARQQPVADLQVAAERGDVDEMSLAFWVIEDEWADDDGQPATWMDGTQRTITEVKLHKGDVSAVNYGANDATEGGFRQLEAAFAELRDGRPPTGPGAELVRALVAPAAREIHREIVIDLTDDGDSEPDPQVLELASAHWGRRRSPRGPGA